MSSAFISKLASVRLVSILWSGSFDRYELVNVGIHPTCIVTVQSHAVKGSVITCLNSREVGASCISSVWCILPIRWPLLLSTV